MRLFDKIWLWFHNYCPMHAVPKYTFRARGGYTWSECPKCEAEYKERALRRAKAVQTRAEELRKNL